MESNSETPIAKADTAAKRSGFGIGELGQASEMDATDQAIRQAQRKAAQQRACRSQCHYCGMPATRSDFYGAAACDDCQ